MLAALPGAEALMLMVLTVTLSFGVFEAVRRVRVLRPWFGLGPQRVGKESAPMTGPAPAAAPT